MFLPVDDSLHGHKPGICLTGPSGNQTELSGEMKAHLVIHSDEGVHVVDVSLAGLLHHFGQHGLRNSLPSVSVESPNQSNVETIILSQLTAYRSCLTTQQNICVLILIFNIFVF